MLEMCRCALPERLSYSVGRKIFHFKYQYQGLYLLSKSKYLHSFFCKALALSEASVVQGTAAKRLLSDFNGIQQIHTVPERVYSLQHLVYTCRVDLSHFLSKGKFCNNSEIDALISKRLSVENTAKHSTNKGRFLAIAKLPH